MCNDHTYIHKYNGIMLSKMENMSGSRKYQVSEFFLFLVLQNAASRFRFINPFSHALCNSKNKQYVGKTIPEIQRKHQDANQRCAVEEFEDPFGEPPMGTLTHSATLGKRG